jgi:hypothetical protein
MRYIKKFDKILSSEASQYYWLIPIDNRQEKSLIEIGCKDYSFIDYDFSKDDRIFDYIFVSYNGGWHFMPYNDDSISYYNKSGREYMGSINITNKELEELEIKKTENKYNL